MNFISELSHFLKSDFLFFWSFSRFLSQIGGSLDQLGSAEVQQQVKSTVMSSGLECLAQSLNTCPETLQLIVDGLTQPPGFDIRQGKKHPASPHPALDHLHALTVLVSSVFVLFIF